MSVILAGQGGKKNRCLRFKADPLRKELPFFNFLTRENIFRRGARGSIIFEFVCILKEGRKDRAFYYRAPLSRLSMRKLTKNLEERRFRFNFLIKRRPPLSLSLSRFNYSRNGWMCWIISSYKRRRLYLNKTRVW